MKESDNAALAEVIKTCLEEQGNNKAGTIYADPLLYKMFSGYQTSDSVYYIAVENGELLGGSGIARIPNQDKNQCELQRMFLSKEAIYDLVYIETFANMHEAIKLYERSGFEYINGAIGDTGHFSCDKFLVKKI